jgi:hypothetical protein
MEAGSVEGTECGTPVAQKPCLAVNKLRLADVKKNGSAPALLNAFKS